MFWSESVLQRLINAWTESEILHAYIQAASRGEEGGKWSKASHLRLPVLLDMNSAETVLKTAMAWSIATKRQNSAMSNVHVLH